MTRTTFVASLAVFSVALLGLPSIRAAGAQGADIESQIRNARTAADHEAIAVYYDRQATDAQAKADEHKKMSEAYKKEGGSIGKTHLHDHCDGLVRVYQSAAKDYRAMADAHRQLAKKAPK